MASNRWSVIYTLSILNLIWTHIYSSLLTWALALVFIRFDIFLWLAIKNIIRIHR